jgi:hypothetical protein
MTKISIALPLFLFACSDDFSRSTPDVSIDANFAGEDASTIDALDELAESRDVSIDSPIAVDSGADVLSCGTDGGACSAGSCCAGLHCVSGACASCKPKGFIASQASECCDPVSFSGSSCGDVNTKCGIPNQSGCMNGVTCCPGSTCKNQGQYWQCTCGAVDTPCTANGECCSNQCAAGWCK